MPDKITPALTPEEWAILAKLVRLHALRYLLRPVGFRHHWRTRTALDLTFGYTVPCRCPWWLRAWYLLVRA